MASVPRPMPSSSTMSGSEPEEGLDPRGPVLAVAVWGGTWVGTSGVGVLAVAGLVLAAALVVVGRQWHRPLLAALGGMLAAGLVTAGARAAALHSGPVAELADERAVAVVEGWLRPGRLVEGGVRGTSWYGLLELEQVHARGRGWRTGQSVLVSASGTDAEQWAGVIPGTRVRAAVRLAAAEASDAFVAIARAREPPVASAPPGWGEAAVHDVRSGLKQAVDGLAEEPRALVPALVVGDTSAMSPELRERFRVTGLAHLAAVSGANLTLLLASLLWLAGRLGVRGWWLRGIAVLGVVGFVALCHGEPSVLRAAAMGCVGLAALGFGGRRRGLRQLAWAVVGLLLVDPWLSGSAGFALSVVASAAIVCWARSWTAQLAGWLPRPLAEAVAVPIAAQLATQPIVVAISGQLSLVGVLANLLAGPLVGPTTVLGFLCAAVAPFVPGLAAAIGWLAGWGAQGLCWIALLGASLPSAAITWPATASGLAVLAGVSVAVVTLMPGVLRRPWLVLLVALMLIVVLLRPATVPGWPPSGWAVVQCDVGQGSATVVAVAPGEAIVVDAGPDPPRLERCLAGLGVRQVPLLVVTHFHADHVGGLPALGGREVGTVLLPRSPSEAGRRLLLAQTAGARHVEAVPGMVIEVAGVRVDVVSALDAGSAAMIGTEAESGRENDASVVTRIDTGAMAVLATGDIEDAGQSAALRSGANLAADVLIVPHHGSADQSPELFAAVGAPIALVGVGQDNDYGHPSATALRLLAQAGTTVYRTDTQGSVAVAPTAAGFQVTTERSG